MGGIRNRRWVELGIVEGMGEVEVEVEIEGEEQGE